MVKKNIKKRTLCFFLEKSFVYKKKKKTEHVFLSGDLAVWTRTLMWIA